MLFPQGFKIEFGNQQNSNVVPSPSYAIQVIHLQSKDVHTRFRMLPVWDSCLAAMSRMHQEPSLSRHLAYMELDLIQARVMVGRRNPGCKAATKPCNTLCQLLGSGRGVVPGKQKGRQHGWSVAVPGAKSLIGHCCRGPSQQKTNIGQYGELSWTWLRFS